MAGERNGDRIAALDTDSRLETIKAEAFTPGQSDEVKSLVEMHLKIARRLMRESAPGRAFAELVRASRAVPMTARLASAMVQISLRAGTEAAAVLLLNAGVEDADGDERIRIRRQLVRLLRRTGELEGAREALVITLAERPSDRRARQVLNALLASEGRWEELDASLEKEVKESLRRGALKRAA
ncbi:MAG: tetratricopeptide repeat protein, partial [Myxococcaceae bacterium]